MDSIAIVCDHYLQRGGTELVVDTLAEYFDAPVYAGWINEDVLPPSPTVEYKSIFDGLSAKIATYVNPLNALYSMWSWQQIPELAEFDVLIQTGDDSGWYVPPDEQILLKYVNSPRNMAYDKFQRQELSPIQYAFLTAYRVAYQSTVSYPDQLIANSELVERRIRRYWGIDDAEVIYPPVDLSQFTTEENDEDFYLAYSRLGPSKNIDEIVRIEFTVLSREKLCNKSCRT